VSETAGGPTTPEHPVTTRAVSLAAGAAAALSLACGSQPATYLIALDQSGLETLPGSCYPTGAPPATPPQFQQWIQHEFTIWEGAQSKHYLQFDAIRVQFPTTSFTLSGLTEGGPKQWTYSTEVDRGNNITETRQMQFSFTDLGATLVGTIAVTDTFACASPPCGFLDCSVTLNLNGRQVDAQYTGQL
jgi:hypothetical protein